MNKLFDLGEVLDTVIHGDALEVLKTFPDECIDAIVCDPPAGISFMNKEFDHDKGGRTQWVAWLASIMREAKRCLRPGGHCLVWSLPRTSHWTGNALEDAGFEIRDCLYNLVSGDTLLHTFIQSLSDEQQHAFMQLIDGQREPSGILQVFGAGFPKSLNVSVALDKLLGKEREIAGYKATYYPDTACWGIPGKNDNGEGHSDTSWKKAGNRENGMRPFTVPVTDIAKQFDGYGTNLKPAVENWWLVRKPLAASSIAENVLEYGVGGLNIDASRVGWETGGMEGQERTSDRISPNPMDWGKQKVVPRDYKPTPQGRFPSHLLITHSPECKQVGTKRVRDGGGPVSKLKPRNEPNVYDMATSGGGSDPWRDEDGMETVTAWECPDWCPVRILDSQGGLRKSGGGIKSKAGHSIGLLRGENAYHFQHDGEHCTPSEGFVSRYFQQLPALDVPPYIYAGKASRKDRNEGFDDLPEKQGFDKNTSKMIDHINHETGETTYNEYHPSSNKNTHPTVKSQPLMRYLTRMICPPNGIVLDCFCGSGSTLVAAIHEGFHFISIEKEEEYVTIARSRIQHAISTVGTIQHIPDTPLATPTATKPKKTRNTPHSSQLSLFDFDKEITA